MTMCLLLNSQIILEALLNDGVKERTKATQTHNINITYSPEDHAPTPSHCNTYL